jgi:hypothetical protein
VKIRDVIYVAATPSLGVSAKAFGARESRPLGSFRSYRRREDQQKRCGKEREPFHEILHIDTFVVLPC